MSLRMNFVLVAAAGALLAACSNQPAPTASASTATGSEPVAVEATATTAGSEAGTTVQAYSLDEVAKHATAQDCWSVVDGVVYDLTDFVSKHPGGSDKIEGMCGKDATDTFNGQHGSDDNAKAKLQGFELGVLSN